jgi:arylsulfatase
MMMAAGTLLTCCCMITHAQESTRPNFLVIVADDMGFSDIGAFGSEIETPNLDTLADSGLRYTAFYNAGRCWPTRTALMTGYYERVARQGLSRFKADMPFVPHQLKQAGYRCYHSGKFHVVAADDPIKAGFDRSYFIKKLDVGFFSPTTIFLDGDPLPTPDPQSGYHVTDEIAERAIEFLSEHERTTPDRPIFLYLAHFAPHWPLHAHQKDIDKYRGRYELGWDKLRENRLQRQKELQLFDTESSPVDADKETVPHWNLKEAGLVATFGEGEVGAATPWNKLTNEQQTFQSEKMAIHAAMIDHMDRSIGQVIEKLKAMGQFENTIIFFLSDNGASAEIMVSRNTTHDQQAKPGTYASYLSMGPAWATAANTPFRLHKHYMHEGGIATPLIVHWSKGIHDKGGIRRTPSHVIDLLPTMLDLAGVKPLSMYNAKPVWTIQGKSLLESFRADKRIDRPFLFFEHAGHEALRNDDWKIVHKNGAPWELYNMRNDRAETLDVANDFPEILQKMVREFNTFKEEADRMHKQLPAQGESSNINQ